MAKKITPAEYEARLAQDGRGFKALEPYVDWRTPILHQCPEGHQRKMRPSNIKKGQGCGDCYENKFKKIAEEYPKWLEQDGRGFIAREPYVNKRTPILHQCPEGHQWRARPNDIKSGDGCRDCYVNKLTNSSEQYNAWLAQDGRGIVAREAYAGSDTPILHQCSEGHPPWKAKPHYIKSGHGCGDCSERATDANVFYIWEDAERAGVYKVGITSERCADKRIAICTRKNKMTANIILMASVRDARAIERRALELGESVDYPSSIDGYTEFRRYTDQELGEVYRMAVQAA